MGARTSAYLSRVYIDLVDIEHEPSEMEVFEFLSRRKFPINRTNKLQSIAEYTPVLKDRDCAELAVYLARSISLSINDEQKSALRRFYHNSMSSGGPSYAILRKQAELLNSTFECPLEI